MDDVLVVLLYGLMQAGIYTLVALGITLVFGVTDILNFAHGEFVTVGAFSVLILTPQVGFGLALVGTLAIVALGAGLLYVVAYRHTVGNHLQGLALSLGVLLISQSLMLRQFGSLPRRGPRLSGFVQMAGANVAVTRIVVTVATGVLVAACYLLLKRTRTGLALRVCGDDEFAARSVGLSPRVVGLSAFVVSAVLAAIAGVAIGAVYPFTPLVGLEFLLKGFVVAIIGGLGSPPGALVAALLLGLSETMGARFVSPAFTTVYGFALMIVVLLAAPQGLFNRKVGRV